MTVVAGAQQGFVPTARRVGVHAAAMIPASIALFIAVAWSLPRDQQAGAVIVTIATLVVTSLSVALSPRSERVVRHLAARSRQSVAGFFAAMYIVSIGVAYLVGGIIHGEGGGGAIIGGAVVTSVGLLPLWLGYAAPDAGTAIWVPYAVILSVLTVLAIPAFGAGLAILAPTVAAWLAVRDRRCSRVADV